VDRQPEFTQIDYEMAFADENTVKAFTEQLVSRLWTKFQPQYAINPGEFDTITYDQAMRSYGSDKPDRRFNMEVSIFSLHVASHKLTHVDL